MNNLVLLALLFAPLGYAETDKNPVGRYFGRVPIERAHVTWGDAASDRLPQTDFDCLVWNVKKGERTSFPEEFKKFGGEKDLLLIQEAYTASFFTDVIKSFRDYQWDLGISFTYRLYNNDGTGNMIGARIKPSWVKVEHTLDLEPLTNTPKTTAYAKFPIEGLEQELLAISVHGINFVSSEAFNRHLGQIREEIAAHDGPVIVAGDFNTRTKERFRDLLKFARELNLQEVKFINGEIRMTAVGTKNILDHVLVRGFEVNHAEVHPSTGSDHKPMTLSLDFL